VKRHSSAAALLIVLCSAAGAGLPARGVDGLAWIAGCWAYTGAEAGSGETWMPPAGGQLLGVARRVEGARVVSYEFQRIAADASGLAYYTSPSGTPEVRFALKSLTANEVVFENSANDFPQRVIYRLAQSGSISARIEGAADDPARAVDFPMKRTSCEVATKR
jgi:Domain of unknown function (DUF6265)